MTIWFTLTLAVEGAATAGGASTRTIGGAVERNELAAEALGLTLAEGKAILAELQAAVVSEQVADRPRSRARAGLVPRHHAADRAAADDQGRVPG